MRAASLNFRDLLMIAGQYPGGGDRPLVPLSDGAGEVAEVGEDVARFKVGDRVWSSNPGQLGRQGTSAEYASVAEDWLYPTPANVPDPEAAAVALVGR